MEHTTRIPPAEVTGLKGALIKRMMMKKLGKVPTAVGVYWHNPKVLFASAGLGGKLQKWDACDESLKSFAHMAVASLVGCTWCLDFNYFEARNRGLDVEKAREIPRWREAGVFTPLERDVLEYAEAMSETPPTVTDELVDRLRRPAGACGRGRADLGDRVREHEHAWQRGARHRVRRLRRRLRAEAAGRAPGGSVRVMSEDSFVAHRSLLFTVAYEMLGSVADAEDVVQETWLRWAALDDAARNDVRDPRAYLVRITSRVCLNRFRTLARRREEYVGEWLPEPVLTSPDVADDVELAESVSIAMLAVLETLLPTERAVFVLREVFDVPYDEIAEALDKSPAAVRQIATRARKHVAARRPRVSVSRTEQQRVVERFLSALTTGDVPGLLEVLAPDVLVVGDGGGLAPTIPKPVRGSAKLAPVMARFAEEVPDATAFVVDLNGGIAARIDPGGANDTAVAFTIEDGRITRIYAIRNPHKLQRLDEVVELRR